MGRQGWLPGFWRDPSTGLARCSGCGSQRLYCAPGLAEWIAQHRDCEPVPIETTLGRLAEEYGVDPPDGGADVDIRLYSADGGWHISADDPAWSGLTDADWAPETDEDADRLRMALADEVA